MPQSEVPPCPSPWGLLRRPPLRNAKRKCPQRHSGHGEGLWAVGYRSAIGLVKKAVHHIRLHCVPELQRALDARFTDDQWRALSTEEALDTIGKLVLRASNKAAQYQEFFSAMQGQEESLSNFFLKCNQKALDCEFNCPNCSGDLTEYMLLHKLMVSLSDNKLKRYIFQSCNKIHSVDACSAFQAARQNLEGGTGLQNPPRAASASVEGNPEREVQTDVASVRTHQPSTRACGNCGGRHAPGHRAQRK